MQPSSPRSDARGRSSGPSRSTRSAARRRRALLRVVLVTAAGVASWAAVVLLPASAETATFSSWSAPRPAAGAPVATGSGTPMPEMVAAARVALARQRWVHLQGELSELDAGVGVFVAVDVSSGLSGGTLSESIASNGRWLRLGAVLTPTRGYCTGDPDALTASCAMSARQAWAVAGHWVSFGPRTGAYRVVRASIVLGDETAGLLPAGAGTRFHLTRTRAYAGRRVIELQGPAAPATGFPIGTIETIDLAATGPELPVAARFVDPGRVSSTESFSAWGKPFAVRVPRHSVAASTLG